MTRCHSLTHEASSPWRCPGVERSECGGWGLSSSGSLPPPSLSGVCPPAQRFSAAVKENTFKPPRWRSVLAKKSDQGK